MQERDLRFGKAVERVVILRGCIHQCGVGFDPGLAEFLLDARGVLANIGSKGPERAELFLTHNDIIPRLRVCESAPAKMRLTGNGCHVPARGMMLTPGDAGEGFLRSSKPAELRRKRDDIGRCGRWVSRATGEFRPG